MEPKVTFIIPVYNGLPYVAEAVDSVLAQTCPEWCLFLVDDCSQDNSRAIIQRYKDPRITCIDNPVNLGLYGSLAAVISKVQTDWVSILMQDDRLKPYYLEEIQNVLSRASSVRALWATEDTIGADGCVVREGRNTFRLENIRPGNPAWLSTLNRGCIWTISGSFTRKDLFQSFPFRTDLPHCGDYEWLLRAIRAESFLYYERSLAELRLHSLQASASNLRRAVDVAERYKILRDNLLLYADELAWSAAMEICERQARMLLRRVIVSISKLRLSAALTLISYFVRFSLLPFTYKRTGMATAIPKRAR